MHSAADAAGRHGADRRGRDAAGAYGEKGQQGQIDAQICVSLASSRNAHVKLHPSNASHAGVRRNTCRPFASLFSSLSSEKKEKFLELTKKMRLVKALPKEQKAPQSKQIDQEIHKLLGPQYSEYKSLAVSTAPLWLILRSCSAFVTD